MTVSLAIAILGEATDTLKARWRGSFLAMLVLAGGVSALMITLSVLQGFTKEIERASFGIHARSLVISSNVFFTGKADPLQLSDLTMLLKKLRGVQSSAAWVRGVASVQVPHSGRLEYIMVFGGMGNVGQETGQTMRDGRMLRGDELKTRKRDCVLGYKASYKLFPDGRSPVHRQLRVNGMTCTIIGVLAPPKDRVAEQYTDAIISPLGTAAYYLIPAKGDRGPSDLTQLTFTFPNQEQAKSQHIIADRALRQRHGIPQSRVSPFTFANQNASADSLRRQRTLVASLLAAVTGITLLTVVLGYSGLISHQSAMRQEEMAIRAAIGAKGSHLMAQMVMEHCMIGLGGGLIGVMVSLGLGLGLASWLPWIGQPQWDWFALALVAGAGLGMAIGLSPSIRAANTPPGLLFGQKG